MDRIDGVMKIRPYAVAVEGFSEQIFFAASPGKARADAWRQYCHCHECTFGEFMKISRVWCSAAPLPGFGAEITVEGKPAYFVSQNRQYVQFAWPDGDTVLNSHPLDVAGVCGEFKEGLGRD